MKHVLTDAPEGQPVAVKRVVRLGQWRPEARDDRRSVAVGATEVSRVRLAEGDRVAIDHGVRGQQDAVVVGNELAVVADVHRVQRLLPGWVVVPPDESPHGALECCGIHAGPLSAMLATRTLPPATSAAATTAAEASRPVR